MSRKIGGTRDGYWSQLQIQAGRLRGHVWSYGERFDVDAALPVDPKGFVALTWDDTVETFEPNDPRLPATASEPPLDLRAHLYVEGEIVESVPICASCGRLPEPDEDAPPAGYDGTPIDCSQCGEIKRTQQAAHEAAVEHARREQAGDRQGAREAAGRLSEANRKLDEAYESHRELRRRAQERHRAAMLARKRGRKVRP